MAKSNSLLLVGLALVAVILVGLVIRQKENLEQFHDYGIKEKNNYINSPVRSCNFLHYG